MAWSQLSFEIRLYVDTFSFLPDLFYFPFPKSTPNKDLYICYSKKQELWDITSALQYFLVKIVQL